MHNVDAVGFEQRRSSEVEREKLVSERSRLSYKFPF